MAMRIGFAMGDADVAAALAPHGRPALPYELGTASQAFCDAMMVLAVRVAPSGAAAPDALGLASSPVSERELRRPCPNWTWPSATLSVICRNKVYRIP